MKYFSSDPSKKNQRRVNGENPTIRGNLCAQKNFMSLASIGRMIWGICNTKEMQLSP
jgi:hypothetical protein